MAKTILVRDFMGGVLTTLVDTAPNFGRWPEVELVRYINLGQMAIATYLPHAGSRVDVIKLEPGTRQDLTKIRSDKIKPGDGTAGVDTYGITLIDVVRYMGPNGTTPGRSVRRVDANTLDTCDRNWHSKTGPVPTQFTADGVTPKTFFVSPGPPLGTGVWVEIKWVAVPPRVPDGGAPGAELYQPTGASTQTFGVDDQFIDDLRNYVLGMALTKSTKNEQNISRAALYAGAFTSSINAKAQAIGIVNPQLSSLPYADQASVMAAG